MATAEINKRLAELGNFLDTCSPSDAAWHDAYDEYCDLSEQLHEIYKAENIGNLKMFYDDHIAGKEWSEIDPDDWGWYSDYHKDVFGYRPRSLNFGEYVSPYR